MLLRTQIRLDFRQAEAPFFTSPAKGVCGQLPCTRQLQGTSRLHVEEQANDGFIDIRFKSAELWP